jgi:hypothetical protein
VHLVSHQTVQRTACRGVGLRTLPIPDSVEYAWDPASVCAILSDGDPLADALARQLFERGWRVIILGSPATGLGNALPTMPIDITRAGAWDETVTSLTERFGRLAAVIDIHGTAAPAGDDLLSSQAEEARLKASFLFARHVAAALTDAALPCAWYFVVTQVDGRLGLAASEPMGGVVTAGALALAKTLRYEWPSVFCRAVDVQPDLDPEGAARLLIGELHDPDATLAEVGIGAGGRCTIAAFEMAHV